MKLVTFRTTPDSATRIGAMTDASDIVDLQTAATAIASHADPMFTSMLSLLDAGDGALARARDMIDAATLRPIDEALIPSGSYELLAPVPRPRSIRDCLAFEKHLVQATRTVISWRSKMLARVDAWMERTVGRTLVPVPKVWYDQPIYYKGNPSSVIGHDADVAWPSFTKKLDYELEFGIFIGKPGRDIRAEDAHQHIAGYSIFNDFSARDMQMREMAGRLGPAKSKDFDTGNGIGPYLVTRDEVDDAQSLTMVARVNGDEWSRGTSADMHFSFAEIIAFISQDETLYPGDFIGSGTVPSGCGLELDRWLQPGDVVELEVESLGTLRNRIVQLETGAST